MVILVPEPKRAANLLKHGIDLADFEAGFSWDRYLRLTAHPSATGRMREVWLGRMAGRIVAVVVSPLGTEALAVISIRPANERERSAYDQA